MSEQIQNKDDQETLGYTDAIQAKIVAMLLFNEAKLAEVADHIKPEYFDNPVHQEFAKIILSHFTKYRKKITADEFLEELDSAIGRDNLKKMIADEYLDAAGEVMQMEAEDFSYVRDRMIFFVRYAEMKKAILDSVEVIRKDKDYGEIVTKVQAAAAIGEPKESILEDILFAEGELKQVEWLWKNRIPKGKLTLIVGDPGVGKSFFTLWIASQVTRGRPWPGEPNCPTEKGKIILLSAEDDLDDTILPRFLANGGDPTLAHLIKGIKNESRMFDLNHDLKELGKKVEVEKEVKLIIIDPVSAYIGKTIDTHKERDVRSLLTPVANFAKKYDVAVVGIVHLNKSVDLGAIYRVTGSMAFVAAARAVWLIAEDKGDSDLRHFAPLKINLGRKPEGLVFKIDDSKEVVITDVAARTSADILLSAEEKKERPRDVARRFLSGVLGNGEEMESREIYAIAEEEGIAEQTLTRASKEIKGLEKFQKGGKWYWRLRLPTLSPVDQAETQN
jgi:putative DNA primase/helicase